MPTGSTTTDSMRDSMDDVVASARLIAEHIGVMDQCTDKETLDEGMGDTWKENSLARLTASNVSETSDENTNYQQITDTAFTITPTLVQIVTLVTEKVAKQLNKKAYAKMGALIGNAVGRKKNQDGLTMLDGATTSLGTTAVTLTYGVVASAVSRIMGNTTEPGYGELFFVAHPYGMRDLYGEMTAPVGTYEMSSGMSADVFRQGFKGQTIATAKPLEDGNITIDSTPDAKGGVFLRKALVQVMDLNQRRDVEWKPRIAGGSNIVTLTIGYGWGERSAGNWLYEVIHDATVPT